MNRMLISALVFGLAAMAATAARAGGGTGAGGGEDGGNAWAKGRAKDIWDGLTTAARGRATAVLAGLRRQRAARP